MSLLLGCDYSLVKFTWQVGHIMSELYPLRIGWPKITDANENSASCCLHASNDQITEREMIMKSVKIYVLLLNYIILSFLLASVSDTLHSAGFSALPLPKKRAKNIENATRTSTGIYSHYPLSTLLACGTNLSAPSFNFVLWTAWSARSCSITLSEVQKVFFNLFKPRTKQRDELLGAHTDWHVTRASAIPFATGPTSLATC